MADAMMKPLGEANGVKWYWAEPGQFDSPGVYYWNGNRNVLCVPYPAAPTEASKPVQAEAPNEAWKTSFGVRVGRDTHDCMDLIFTTVGQREFQLYPNEAAHLRDLLNAASIPGYPATKQAEAPTTEPLTMRAALEEINSWLVCASIATPEDMAQSFQHMQQVCERALATQPTASNAEPIARIEFRRGEAGRENEMPRVVSCNWLPDGIYEVYLADPTGVQPCCGEYAKCHRPCTPRGRWLALATQPTASNAGEREAFESWAVKNICHKEDLKRGRLTGYMEPELNSMWKGWLNRAALAQVTQQVARGTHRINHGVVYVCDIHDRECGGLPASWCEDCPKRRAARTSGDANHG